MRTSALCLLVLLSVLATASRVQAQAVLNPNQISGHLAFANQNPEILNIFDRSGLDQGFSSAWVRADSIGITPPLNNHTYLQAENHPCHRPQWQLRRSRPLTRKWSK